MSLPSYITTEVVDTSFVPKNIALLQAGPPDYFLLYDTLTTTQQNDLARLVATNGGKLPLASMALMDTVLATGGLTFNFAYQSLIHEASHFDQVNLPAAGGGITSIATAPDYNAVVVSPLAGKVDNSTLTAEVTNRTNADALLIPLSQKGAALGVSTLDGTTHIPAAQIPAPTLTTLGGVQAVSPVTHQFVTSVNTSGVPTLAQPASTDLSDIATVNASIAAKQTAFIAPRTEGSSVTLVSADNGGVSVTPVACVVTVNTGLGLGFGRGFTGAGVVSFAGTATVTDKRITGAVNPLCGLMCTGTDTYDVVGGKA